MKPRFLITIDTEGDNIWARRSVVTTRNTAYLPRFQALCERFGFKPTWLTNYEMAMDPAFVEFGRDVMARGTGEIGMHLHAWNSPPFTPLTADDTRHHPYLIEFPDAVMREKLRFMTDLLEQRFACKMVSHRAGRWAFDTRYARMLVELGYTADCSVTPGVSWRGHPGAPGGNGGTDYRRFPAAPYFLHLDDIARPGASPLLEVPMTTRRSFFGVRLPMSYAVPGVRGVCSRVMPEVYWLRPNGRNLQDMLRLTGRAIAGHWPHLEFMLHSSELMPGGSPGFGDERAIEKLYRDLEALFRAVAPDVIGTTLAEFAGQFRASHAA